MPRMRSSPTGDVRAYSFGSSLNRILAHCNYGVPYRKLLYWKGGVRTIRFNDLLHLQLRASPISAVTYLFPPSTCPLTKPTYPSNPPGPFASSIESRSCWSVISNFNEALEYRLDDLRDELGDLPCRVERKLEREDCI